MWTIIVLLDYSNLWYSAYCSDCMPMSDVHLSCCGKLLKLKSWLWPEIADYDNAMMPECEVQ